MSVGHLDHVLLIVYNLAVVFSKNLLYVELHQLNETFFQHYFIYVYVVS